MQGSTIEAFKDGNEGEGADNVVTVGLKSGADYKGTIVIDDGFIIITQGDKVTYVSFEDIEALTCVPTPHVEPRE